MSGEQKNSEKTNERLEIYIQRKKKKRRRRHDAHEVAVLQMAAPSSAWMPVAVSMSNDNVVFMLCCCALCVVALLYFRYQKISSATVFDVLSCPASNKRKLSRDSKFTRDRVLVLSQVSCVQKSKTNQNCSQENALPENCFGLDHDIRT